MACRLRTGFVDVAKKMSFDSSWRFFRRAILLVLAVVHSNNASLVQATDVSNSAVQVGPPFNVDNTYNEFRASHQTIKGLLGDMYKAEWGKQASRERLALLDLFDKRCTLANCIMCSIARRAPVNMFQYFEIVPDYGNFLQFWKQRATSSSFKVADESTIVDLLHELKVSNAQMRDILNKIEAATWTEEAGLETIYLRRLCSAIHIQAATTRADLEQAPTHENPKFYIAPYTEAAASSHQGDTAPTSMQRRIGADGAEAAASSLQEDSAATSMQRRTTADGAEAAASSSDRQLEAERPLVEINDGKASDRSCQSSLLPSAVMIFLVLPILTIFISSVIRSGVQRRKRSGFQEACYSD